MAEKRRLHRSQDDKIFAGVCGGIAEHLDVDPTLVRIGVILVTFFTGLFPIPFLYIALAFILPMELGGYEDLEESDSAEVLEGEVVDAEFSSKEVDAWGLQPAGVQPAESDKAVAPAEDDDGEASTGGNTGAASLGGSV